MLMPAVTGHVSRMSITDFGNQSCNAQSNKMSGCFLCVSA